MFGVFIELTFGGNLTFWRLTISPSITPTVIYHNSFSFDNINFKEN
jgi:hypothetical protein